MLFNHNLVSQIFSGPSPFRDPSFFATPSSCFPIRVSRTYAIGKRRGVCVCASITKGIVHLIQLSQLEWRNCDKNCRCRWYFRERERRERSSKTGPVKEIVRKGTSSGHSGAPHHHIGRYRRHCAYEKPCVQMFSTPLLAAIRFRRWKQHRGLTPNVSRSVVQSFGNIGSREIDRREITVDHRRRINPLIDYIDQCVIWRHLNPFSRKSARKSAFLSFFLFLFLYHRIVKRKLLTSSWDRRVVLLRQSCRELAESKGIASGLRPARTIPEDEPVNYIATRGTLVKFQR